MSIKCKSPHHPIHKGQYQVGWNIPSKIKWKIHVCFTRYFKFWTYFLKKVARYRRSFISCCLTSVFTSADIIFYSFSELDSKLSKKTFSSLISLFQWIHPNPLTPKIHYAWWKFSVDASLVSTCKCSTSSQASGSRTQLMIQMKTWQLFSTRPSALPARPVVENICKLVCK